MMENGVKAEQPLEEAPGDETPKPEQTSSKGLWKTEVLIAGLLLAIVGYCAWQLWYECYYKGSTAHLLKLAQSDDKLERAVALMSLGRRGGEEGVLDALISGMSDESGLVRSSSAFALQELGPAAKPAVPALIRATRDPDELVRTAALMALEETGVTDRRVAEAMLEVIKGKRARLGEYSTACSVLEKIIRSDPSLVPLVETALDELDNVPSICDWQLRRAIREIREGKPKENGTLFE